MACLLTLILIAPVFDDPVFSGPQAGEKISPFAVLMVQGSHAGQELQLGTPDKSKKLLLVFIHELTRPAMQLLRPLDHFATAWAGKGLDTHIVFLTGDRTRTEEYLKQARSSLSFTSPLSISKDGIEGPGSYGLNRKVALTILVVKDGRVTSNFAIVQPNETDGPKVLKPLAELVGQPAPSLEQIVAQTSRRVMDRPTQDRPAQAAGDPGARARIDDLEKHVEALTAALNEANARLARLEGKPAPTPIRSLSERGGRSSQNPELQGLMRQLIQPTNDAATAARVAAEMTKWAGDDAARKSEVKEFCKLVYRLGYGSAPGRQQIKKLAGE